MNNPKHKQVCLFYASFLWVVMGIFSRSGCTLSTRKVSTLFLGGQRMQLQQLSSSFHFPCVSKLRVCYSAPHAKWLAPACIISTLQLWQQSGTNWVHSEASQHSVHDGPHRGSGDDPIFRALVFEKVQQDRFLFWVKVLISGAQVSGSLRCNI